MLTGEHGQSGSGFLLLLLATWSWLRLWQRCSAEPDSPCAQGHSTISQRALLSVFILTGGFDALGPDGLGLHTWLRFGSLKSHHWLFGLLKAMALECQMRLLTMLKHRENVLRILGATRMMSLALVLFLGGLTASVGFLVSRSEFTRFVDTLAPPSQVMTVILALRKRRAVDALIVGAGAGILWQVPEYASLVLLFRLFGVAVGAFAVAKVADAFEEHRDVLVNPSGGRLLLLFPESSEKARTQAMQVWTQFRAGAAEVAVSGGAQMVGKSVISGALDYAASFWTKAPLEAVVQAVEVAEAAPGL